MIKAEFKRENKKIIDTYKDDTAYFDGSMSKPEIYEMLRSRMKFGEAETKVIIAALNLAGAKFRI